MYGSDINTFRVKTWAEVNGLELTQFSRTGHSGDYWERSGYQVSILSAIPGIRPVIIILSEVCYQHEVCQPAVIHTYRGFVCQMRARTTSVVTSFASLPSLPWGIMGVSWPSGLAYRTQVLVLAAECGFESRPWHLCPWARHLTIIASLHPGVKWVPVRAELVD